MPMSSALSILSDWYGRVKKKSNAIVETIAAMTPAIRPPAAAARITTTTKARAMFAATTASLRNATKIPVTTKGPKPARARPSALNRSSRT